MSVFGSSGFHADPGLTQGVAILLGTPPAGSFVSKVDVQGYVNTKITQVSFTAGGVGNYDLAAGIQFGPQGYAPHIINDGSAGGGNWWSWGNLIPPAIANQDIPGTSPQTVVQGIGYPISVSLRQYIAIHQATDVYLIIGGDTSRTFMPFFESYVTFNMEWASFP